LWLLGCVGGKSTVIEYEAYETGIDVHVLDQSRIICASLDITLYYSSAVLFFFDNLVVKDIMPKI
jgi:hypothetical protein